MVNCLNLRGVSLVTGFKFRMSVLRLFRGKRSFHVLTQVAVMFETVHSEG
jgi:hypothetical protein